MKLLIQFAGYVCLAAFVGIAAFPATTFGITFTALNFPQGNYTYTSPLAISGNTIVGQYFTSSGKVAGFTYNTLTQSWTSLDDPDAPARGGGTYPDGISGATVVGFYGASDPLGFTYDGNAWTTAYVAIGSFGSYPSGYPTGISGNQIVGIAQYANGPQQGYTGSIGGPYTLLPNPAGLYISPTGISGNVIVGFEQGAPQPPHGFVYDGGQIETLDDPFAAGFTFPFGVSGSSVVGDLSPSKTNADIFDQGSTGFLFDGTTWTTISDPLGTNGTWVRGIDGNNVVGWYLDSSNKPHAFLAVVPEPSSLVLILLAIPVLALSRLTNQRR